MPKFIEKYHNFYCNFINGHCFKIFQFMKAGKHTFPLEYIILKIFSKLTFENWLQKDIIIHERFQN